MRITKDSHLDHNLSVGQLDFLKKHFANRTEFFAEAIELPEELGTIEVSLVGPETGATPVPEEDVLYTVRGDRKCASRVFRTPPKRPQSRLVTVIAGPHEEHACVLYTAYGGPKAPREPGDPYIGSWDELQEARRFWANHALIV